MSALADAVDAAAGGRVLVFGSPPPDGRDLDILARAEQCEAIAAALADEGLVSMNGARWVAFARCTAAAVDLVDASDWGLADGELRSLLDEAQVLDGYEHLAAPSPRHALLIAARRVARAGRYGETLRTRVQAAVAADPAAWQDAAARARAWHAERELSALRAFHEEEASPGARERLRSVSIRVRAASPARRRGVARSARRLGGRPLIVALSGLDGAGKSFQAKRLADALTQLDHSARVVWPPASNVLFQANPALKRGLFGVLRMLGRGDANSPKRADDGATALRDEAGQEQLPPQRAPLAHALALIVALVQAWSFRRGARPGRGRVDVIIFDRYVLDAVAYLRHRWGHGRTFPIQSALIRLLARRPDVAFFLDVAPEVAYARKRDFPLKNLRERAALYRALDAPLGCTRLDGECPREELCGEIARAVWRLLV